MNVEVGRLLRARLLMRIRVQQENLEALSRDPRQAVRTIHFDILGALVIESGAEDIPGRNTAALKRASAIPKKSQGARSTIISALVTKVECKAPKAPWPMELSARPRETAPAHWGNSSIRSTCRQSV